MPDAPGLPTANAATAEAIELAAAEWLVLEDHGLDARQQQDFERWLAGDARHAAAYARVKETWHLLDRVPVKRVPLPRQRGRRWVWAAGSLAAAAALAIALVGQGWRKSQLGAPAQRAATPIGGFESLTLADGSSVRLNTATEVSVNYTAEERRVTLLRGEASFDVAKDAERPFVVRAGEVEVRAVGTIFNVRQSDRAIEVLVVEGKVRVDEAVSGRSLVASEPAGENAGSDSEAAAVPVLTAGKRATIVRAGASVPLPASVAEVAPAESARALAWHSRQLEFSNEPLANIAAEFNRYNRHRLVIDDPELAAQRFGGKFPADDFAAFVRVLELNFGMVAEHRTNETVLRRGPGSR